MPTENFNDARRSADASVICSPSTLHSRYSPPCRSNDFSYRSAYTLPFRHIVPRISIFLRHASAPAAFQIVHEADA